MEKVEFNDDDKQIIPNEDVPETEIEKQRRERREIGIIDNTIFPPTDEEEEEQRPKIH